MSGGRERGIEAKKVQAWLSVDHGPGADSVWINSMNDGVLTFVIFLLLDWSGTVTIAFLCLH